MKATDPAGKWKIQQMDASGQLVRVIEPNPAGGRTDTNYTYNVLGHLTDGEHAAEQRGRRRGTLCTRGTDLTSATNPENGTVTYQYDAAHRVTKRTDAKGQETRYMYDAYGRMTQVQHWAAWVRYRRVASWAEPQRVNY